MANDQGLREHLRYLLQEGGAHLDFEAATKDIPVSIRGTRPGNGPHSLWELLEHMRIAQWDILEFTRNAAHVSPEFPTGYWPKTPTPPSEKAWDDCISAFRADKKAIVELLENPATDLFAPLKHGEGQTVLREVLLAADHTAYHLGQFMLVRKQLGHHHGG